MAGLDCPMQTKAFNLFWHKAELRLVKQTEPEAPVFAISRPSFFGGREEFLLQYPARLEPPSERDISRHRFTVRHGKKRRSFQAPDAATFDSWLSALGQALEPEKESEQFNTPKTTSSNATTAASSHGRASTAGSSDTRGSSRARVGSLVSNCSSQRSHGSQPRAPALRLTLERPCFTRDRNNLKLIRLHRPAATIAGKAEADDDILDVPDIDTDVEEPEKEVTDVPEEEAVDSKQDDISLDGGFEAVANGVDPAEVAVAEDEKEVVAVMEMLVAKVIADSLDNEERAGIAVIKIEDGIEPEVEAAVEALVAAVVENNDDNETIAAQVFSSTDVDAIEPEATSTVKAIVLPVIKADDDTTIEPTSAVAAVASAPVSIKKESTPKSARRSSARNRWVPLDPTNSRLLWVRSTAEKDVRSAPRSNPRRKTIKPARQWVPVDPSSTRLVWIRRVESAVARKESRYKAASNTRKWVPLDPSNSKFIWVRRQVVPVAGVAQRRH
ncbi:hypothetical protein V7S43_000864 [Phytophthora oleae]|uniref:PH domain-containing protein n=1 Tax=Phytophthora oleae TaxID=2107226 RepID=A0ABD3G6Y8_9STRA